MPMRAQLATLLLILSACAGSRDGKGKAGSDAAAASVVNGPDATDAWIERADLSRIKGDSSARREGR